MAREMVLHHITAVDSEVLDFLDLAKAVGSDHVSLFTCLPSKLIAALKPHLHLPPAVTPENKRDVLKKLKDTGIKVSSVEFFPILAEIQFDEYIAGMAIGRELGAPRGVTHIIDTDEKRAIDNLGKLCALAKKEGLSMGIEFTPTTPGCKTIQHCAWFIDQVGASNLGLGVDALHLIRGGGTAADVAKLDARYILNGQICDGHGLQVTSSYMEEVHNREMPGKGDFPLKDIFNAVPASVPLEIEIPFAKRQEKGVAMADHLREAVARSKALMESLTPTR